MPYLIDTNVLLRIRHRTAPEYPVNVYGLPNLLTLNPADFARFRDISAVHPQDVR